MPDINAKKIEELRALPRAGMGEGAISLASIDEGAPRPKTWKERAPADADLLLRLIHKKRPLGPWPAGRRRRRIGQIVRLGSYLIIRS